MEERAILSLSTENILTIGLMAAILWLGAGLVYQVIARLGPG